MHNYRLAFLSLFSAFFSFAVLAGAFLIAFLESRLFPIFIPYCFLEFIKNSITMCVLPVLIVYKQKTPRMWGLMYL